MRNEISWKEYCSLRPIDLKKKEYRHLWLLLYWPVELAFFTACGRLPWTYHPISCALDWQIPFLEVFIVPYVLWFVCGAFISLYTLRWSISLFRRFMDYMILTILIAGLVFLVYPNYFPGRPVTDWPVSQAEAFRAMPRQNVFSWIVSITYATDPPRNALPSEHVVVAFGMACVVLQDKRLGRPAFAVPFVVLQLLVCVSVVFVKQHSALDVLAALPLCLLGYLCCFCPRTRFRRREKSAEG
jgi:membrane-associated phospholipid phosphatase